MGEMETGQERTAGTARTVAGCLLILATLPAFMVVVPRFAGLAVVGVGLIAFATLALGAVLAGRWLGVFHRGRSGPAAQPGCLPLIMTLVMLLSVAIVLFYTVYYGAGAYLGGWNV